MKSPNNLRKYGFPSVFFKLHPLYTRLRVSLLIHPFLSFAIVAFIFLLAGCYISANSSLYPYMYLVSRSLYFALPLLPFNFLVFNLSLRVPRHSFASVKLDSLHAIIRLFESRLSVLRVLEVVCAALFLPCYAEWIVNIFT